MALVSLLLKTLETRGVEVPRFLGDLGIDARLFGDPDGRLAADLYVRIEEAAAQASGDPQFGLHMGEATQTGSWSVLGALMAQCRTLGEAVEKSGRYYRILGDLLEGKPRLVRGRAEVLLVPQPGAPPVSRHCYESALAGSVTLLRALTGRPLVPFEVRFSAPDPGNPGEYARVFGCPVRFGQKDNALVMDPALAALPVRYSHPGLRERMEAYARDLLGALDGEAAATRAVERRILESLADEGLSVRTVARDLGTSVRTLQDRLKAEGSRFSDLKTGIRQAMARRYLQEGLGTEEIAFLLGYADPSAFRKAFKGWTGLPPGEFRKTRPRG